MIPIPIKTDYRMGRTPWVNYALLAANVIIFVVLDYNLIGEGGSDLIENGMLHPHAPELYQFFTSVFLHAGWQHLLGNMVFLWVFGNAMNDRFGHVGYLAFYLAGGVLADVGYLGLSGDAPVLGASGAIAAVTGAYLVLLPRTRVTVLFWFYVITYFEVSSLLFLAFQVVWNLYMSLNESITGASAGGVAYAAHSAGYVYGIIIAAGLLALRVLPRDAHDLLNLISHAHRRGRYRRMVSRGYDPFNNVGRPGATQRRKVLSRSVSARAADTTSAREIQLRREVADAWARHDLPGATAKYLQLVQIADGAVLPRQQQLDVANQMMSTSQHAAAADAYERFIEHHGTYEHMADIYLMLGLLYSRYLEQYDRAERHLEQAVKLLDDPGKIEMATSDLRKVREGRSA